MDSNAKQLVDSLTDHIALYHSTSNSKPSKSQFRNNAVQWMSSLTAEQRQAALTTVDESWLAIVLQMHNRLQTDGPGFFILLTDVLVSQNDHGKDRHGFKPQADDVALPSLCYRKAKGLLARVNTDNEAERILMQSIRFFSSTEGEFLSPECTRLDSLTVAEDLVKDADRFLAVMDAISNCDFLRSAKSPPSACKWEELPWLKAKGYYSLAAFVANKLELSLRLSWLHSHGKKRSSRMNSMANSHEVHKNGRDLAGIASNVFWRKKACVDWWSKVNETTRAEAFKLAVAKVAKFEVNKLVQGAKISKTEMHINILGNKTFLADKYTAAWKVSNVPKVSLCDNDFTYHPFSNYACKTRSCTEHFLRGLNILQEVSSLGFVCMLAVPENDILFFSSLSSVHTWSDNILRTVREIFAKISKASVELDLLREDNLGDKLNQHKAAEIQRKEKRKKGRSRKKKIPISKQPIEHDSPNGKLCEEQENPAIHDEDKRKGMRSSLPTNSGMKEIEESYQNFACQEENKISKSLQTDSEKVPSVSGIGVGQIKRNKHRSRRSKCKKKEIGNFDAALLSNDKERKLGDFLCEPLQQVDPLPVTFTQCSLLQHVNSNGHSDIAPEGSCSQNISFTSSVNSKDLCGVDSGRVSSDEHSITCSDNMAGEVPLSKHGSTCKKASTNLPTTNIPCKFDSSDINEDGLQKDSSSRCNISEIDKGDVNCLSRDSSSISGFVGSLFDINSSGKMLATAIDSSFLMNHGELNKEYIECSVKPDLHFFQMHSSDNINTESSGASAAAHVTPRDESQQQLRMRTQGFSIQDTTNFMLPTSYEWPGSLPFRVPSATGRLLPTATDRLHLEDWNWRTHLQPSLVTLRRSWVRQSSGQGNYHKKSLISQATGNSNMISSISHPMEPVLAPLLQPSFQAGYVSSNIELNGHIRIKEDSKHEGTDDSYCDDLKYLSGDTDDFEGYAISEDEAEKHPTENERKNSDYNQVFGGGVMYWNTADYAGTGYSRPPSLSSEDSSWARHEDDLKLVIDDIISLPPLPSPYGNSGISSPPKTFRSVFDQFATGTPSTHAGFVKTGNEFNGNFFAPNAGSAAASEERDNRSTVQCNIVPIDGIKEEALPHPILRPIVVPNMSRQKSRTDIAHPRESRSPCVPCNRREPPRPKRPPSPVVLCVPPPPPPSPVRGFRQQRQFPAVRSGSSSPRHWGISNWRSEAEMDMDDGRIATGHPEVAGFAWRSKCITGTPTMHSIPSSLLHDRLIGIPKLALEQEHPDTTLPLQSPVIQNNPALQVPLAKLHSLLHDEIDCFCKQVATENLMRKPFINAAVGKVSRALQVLWPRSRTKIFGSIATGLALPTSDVDLVVRLPPVRNLEPIKEAGILEGRNGIKETCLQHAARYLADQEWVKSDSLKAIENTAIPIIMLVVKVPSQNCSRNEDCTESHISRAGPGEGKEEVTSLINVESKDSLVNVSSGSPPCESREISWGYKDNREAVRLDISFESSSHTGLRTANLVRELTGKFPAILPLAVVLKQFLTDRCLDHPYSGGLSSYCLVLLITRFLQHQHHTGRSINQNLGSLMMDFLYFFGCVFDPRQMRVSIYGSGMYVNRGRGQSIDPLYIDDPIDDPLHPVNNVGRNCFRIHQCVKAFADAHSTLEKELGRLSDAKDLNEFESGRILPNIIPSIADLCNKKK